jgi:hypothetical protein
MMIGKRRLHSARHIVLSLGMVAGLGWPAAGRGAPDQGRGHVTDAHPGASSLLAQLPLRFEPNRGQFPNGVRYLARGQGYSLALTADGATLGLSRTDSQASVGIRVAGGRRVEPRGLDALPGRTNYLIGNDAAKWKTNLEVYARVRYANVLPGVDVIYYGTGARRLEYDVVIAPGVEPERAAFAITGARSIEVDSDGSAVLRLAGGDEIRQPPPVAFQEDAAGVRTPVAARYEKRTTGTLGFAVGAYDRRRALVIDPAIAYSTYLGGSAYESGNSIAVDGAHNVYVLCSTTSADFPLSGSPPIQGVNHGGPEDVTITKLAPDGGSLIYSTYLGGSMADEGYGIAVDAAGNAYVTGLTDSTDFPTVLALQPHFGGGSLDAFLSVLAADGSALLSSTYLGGNLSDQGHGVAVDPDGRVYVAGTTSSPNFPTVAPRQAALAGGSDAFVSAFYPLAAGFIYSTYHGGSDVEEGLAIAVDAGHNAFLVGRTHSTDLPTQAAYQSTFGGSYYDAFAARFNATGSALVYSTYLGGSGDDVAYAVAVDGSSNAYVAGATNSGGFPPGNPSLPYADGFVFKLTPAGTRANSMSLGSGGGAVMGVALDAAANVYLASSVTLAGSVDSIVVEANLTTAVPTNVYYRSFGGTGSDAPTGVAVDGTGAAYVVGSTGSTDYPIASPLQGSLHGTQDAFVTKMGCAGTGNLLVTLVPNGGLNVTSASYTLTGAGQTINGSANVAGTPTQFQVGGLPCGSYVVNVGSGDGTWQGQGTSDVTGSATSALSVAIAPVTVAAVPWGGPGATVALALALGLAALRWRRLSDRR